MGKIDDDLEDEIGGLNDTPPKENIKDLIRAVSTFISQDNTGEITFLTPENVIGIEEALVYQQWIEEIFGWRIDAIDKLIITKCIYTKSIDGRLLTVKIRTLEALQANINATIEPGVSLKDQLLGEVNGW